MGMAQRTLRRGILLIMHRLPESPLTFENGLTIEYTPQDDGGGSIQYTDFLNYIKSTGKTYKHCFEWCAGHGAIGYSLLDAGICESVTFMDIYEPALVNILRNAAVNNVADKVTVYHLDSVGKLPKDLKFDLVVGNPPHSFAKVDFEGEWYRKIVDEDWKIHREFFMNINDYLELNSDIILSETCSTHYPNDLSIIAESCGLKFVGINDAPSLMSDQGVSHGSLHCYKN